LSLARSVRRSTSSCAAHAHTEAGAAATLARLQGLGGEAQRSGPAAPLVDVLFGRRPPRFAAAPPAWRPLNPGLDESQRRAVTLALAAQDVALIHGGRRRRCTGGGDVMWLSARPLHPQMLAAVPVMVG
jgi:hypothetical protein